MGSRRIPRDFASGLVMALVLYIGFTRGSICNCPPVSWPVSSEMGPLTDLAHGFQVALTPENLLWALIGVLLGTAVGVLPGIGPALTVALLLPVTYRLEPVSAFIMFAGIYYGGMYGGSTTSILLNTPGESASIVTAIEGNKMARKGRGAAALATAAIGSFVAGTIGTIGLTFLAPVMVQIGLRFGPAEYFALVVLAFTTVTALLGSAMARGLLSLFLGLAIGLIGIEQRYRPITLHLRHSAIAERGGCGDRRRRPLRGR